MVFGLLHVNSHLRENAGVVVGGLDRVEVEGMKICIAPFFAFP
jgi:hypothetical protein